MSSLPSSSSRRGANGKPGVLPIHAHVTHTAGNSRFRRAKAVAILAGLDVETDPNFTMKDAAWKTPEFLAKFPFGYLPAYEGADGVNLQECGAIADYCE